jgi:hypothetical protein
MSSDEVWTLDDARVSRYDLRTGQIKCRLSEVSAHFVPLILGSFIRLLADWLWRGHVGGGLVSIFCAAADSRSGTKYDEMV